MKISEQCLACRVNQSVKTAKLVGAEHREELYKKISSSMSNLDFSKTNPEIVGENYRLIKEHTGCTDTYRETKQYYNRLFLENIGAYEEKIQNIEEAVKYAIVANIIDFNPVHSNVEEDAYFMGMDKVATIISNGDYSLGTILSRTSADFLKVYQEADVVIAKGQANYESLSGEKKDIYFLLMTKCKVIADDIGTKEKALVCMKNKLI